MALPFTVLSVIVASVFSVLSSNKNPWVLQMVGGVSVLTAVLSGIQTFLNYSQRAYAHQNAANQFGKLRRRVDEFLQVSTTETDLEAILKTIRGDWDDLEKTNFPLSDRASRTPLVASSSKSIPDFSLSR